MGYMTNRIRRRAMELGYPDPFPRYPWARTEKKPVNRERRRWYRRRANENAVEEERILSEQHRAATLVQGRGNRRSGLRGAISRLWSRMRGDR